MPTVLDAEKRGKGRGKTRCATRTFATSSSTPWPRSRIRSWRSREITSICPSFVSTTGMRTGGIGCLSGSRRRGSTSGGSSGDGIIHGAAARTAPPVRNGATGARRADAHSAKSAATSRVPGRRPAISLQQVGCGSELASRGGRPRLRSLQLYAATRPPGRDCHCEVRLRLSGRLGTGPRSSQRRGRAPHRPPARRASRGGATSSCSTRPRRGRRPRASRWHRS